MPPPDFDLCVTDHCTGPDFNKLISITLSPRPNSIRAATLQVALFNAISVNDPLQRAEISTFISDNQVDILFLTESRLCQQGDEAKCSDLAPTGFSVCSFPPPSHGGGIAVVYSDTLAKCLTSTSLFLFHHPSFEAAHISLTLSPNSLYFVCVYRPLPSRKNKLTDAMFHDEFTDLLDFCDNLLSLIHI